MKKTLYLCLCALSVAAMPIKGTAQIITTYAGGNPLPLGDGGPATAAHLDYPTAVAADASGNVYIVDARTNRVRKVSSSGTISTFAGNGTAGYAGDGAAANAANINEGIYAGQTGGVYAFGTSIYIADAWNNVVRKVDGAGFITTVAGNNTAGFGGDGSAATTAMLDTPAGICLDAAGNLYIADMNNNRIRKVTPAGIISTVAGNGTPGFSGDGTAAITASIDHPTDVKVDAAGNIYIADWGNRRIRKVNPSGTISTYAGNGSAGYTGDGGSALSAGIGSFGGITLDAAGTLFIAGGGSVRKVNTMTGIISNVAGNGTYVYCCDGSLATTAGLTEVWGAVFDTHGALYIADAASGRVRKIPGVGVTGVAQVNHPAAITLAPNPNNGTVTISGTLNTKSNETVALTVTNMLGQVVYTATITANNGNINDQVNLGNIANGVYILNMTTGTETIVSRFVVEK
jgi:trimeric autotransporter adhesin